MPRWIAIYLHTKWLQSSNQYYYQDTELDKLIFRHKNNQDIYVENTIDKKLIFVNVFFSKKNLSKKQKYLTQSFDTIFIGVDLLLKIKYIKLKPSWLNDWIHKFLY